MMKSSALDSNVPRWNSSRTLEHLQKAEVRSASASRLGSWVGVVEVRTGAPEGGLFSRSQHSLLTIEFNPVDC